MENSLKLNIENDSISEKEFLKEFLLSMDIALDEYYVDVQIDKFLTEFHKEYYEVEFIKCRSRVEIYADEISDLSLVLDKDLPPNQLVIKVDDEIVKTVLLPLNIK